MTHLGPDLSNYQKQFSFANAQTIRANGCTFVILGRQRANRPYIAQQAAAALDAGLLIVGEYWMSLGGAWPEPLPETKFIAIDVEPGGEFTTEQDIDNALAQVATTGRIPVIYTSAWAWDALGLSGLTKYGEQGIALWNANYDGISDSFALFRPFGGWTTCAIDQYTDKGTFGLDYGVDANGIADAFWNRCFAGQPHPTTEPVVINDPNHADGYDTGADRIDVETVTEIIARIHKRAEGDRKYLAAAITKGYGG